MKLMVKCTESIILSIKPVQGIYILGVSLPHRIRHCVCFSQLYNLHFQLLIVLGCVMHPRCTQLKFNMAANKSGWKMTTLQGPCFTLGVNIHLNIFEFTMYLLELVRVLISYTYIYIYLTIVLCMHFHFHLLNDNIYIYIY